MRIIVVEYFGNCRTIDWAKLIRSLEKQKPASTGTSYKRGDPVDGVDKMADLWEEAGYGNNASWDFFFPEVNFDKQIVLDFAKWAGVKKYTNAWISRVNPGHVAPWHWDATNDIKTLSKPTKMRLHCHMQAPQNGHCLFVEKHSFYREKKGSVYRWSSRNLWHGAINCGIKPMYTFNFRL